MAAIEGEKKVEKEKILPKDAQVMVAILKDMGINDFEPRVINQMLEFSYRYVTTILEDARVYSNHAKKKSIDMEDVKLAVQLATEESFTSPPPREALLELARAKNAIQLPLIQPKTGIRLPPDRHCLTATNYKLKSKQKPSGFDYGGGGGGGVKPQYRSKTGAAVKTTVKNPSSFSVVGNSGKQQGEMGDINLGVGGQPAVFKIQVAPAPLKRKREDEDYDAN